MAAPKPFVITIVGAESSGKSTLAMRLAEELGGLLVPEYAREYLENLERDYNEKDLEIIAERQLERILAVVNRESLIVRGSRSDFFAPDPLMLRLPDTHPGSPAQQPGESNDNNSEVKFEVESWSYIKSKIQSFDLLTHNLVLQLSNHPKSKIIIVDGGMLTLRMWARIKYKIDIAVVEEAMKDDVTDLYLLCRPRREWSPDPLREAPKLMDRVWIYNLYAAELMRMNTVMAIVEGGQAGMDQIRTIIRKQT